MENFLEPLMQIKDQILLVLALAAGSGGIMYWVDRWRNRVRLSIEILSIDALFFEMEVENLGAIPTSLKKRISVKGFSGDSNFSKKEHTYEIVNPERKLPPKEPKRFSCHIPKEMQDAGEDYSLELPRYYVQPTVGSMCIVYAEEHTTKFDKLAHRILPRVIGPIRYWFMVLKRKIG